MGVIELNEINFKKILIAQNCDNSFAEWRYVFEKKGYNQINFELLRNLNESLGSHLFELIGKEKQY